MKKLDYRLHRLDANRIELPNSYGVPVRVFANEEVPIDRVAVDELTELLQLQETIMALYEAQPDLFDQVPGLEAVALSSDFHKGSGIPIGTTLRTRGVMVPQAVGTDVNCGMRVMTTDLSYNEIRGHLDGLERRLRHIFFEGGRRIGLTQNQREAMLREGIPGLLDSGAMPGTEAWMRAADELSRINGGGGSRTDVPANFADYIRGAGGDPDRVSYDAQIGSLGGGNHFAEIQVVGKMIDRATAHAWDLTREGQVVIMIHTGSLGLGHSASAVAKAAMRSVLGNLCYPQNGILALPLGERCAAAVAQVRAAIQVAANFAFANRFYLARMVEQALVAEFGHADARLLWDSPHNLLWEEDGGVVTHRKGSTPARAPEALAGTDFPWGEPVIVPGSMGAPSYILRSQGNAEALYSACHGAGRALSRGAAQHVADSDLDAFLDRFRVVTPVDPRTIQGRRDLLEAWRRDLKQEAPFAYKAIGPVIATLEAAQVATPVAELHPVLTIKG